MVVILEVVVERPDVTDQHRPDHSRLLRVHNGSSQRDHGAQPRHASWLNQIEIHFSIVQRKVLSPNDFTDLDAVSDRLSAFENRYNQTAQPFKWKFTTADLTELLTRLDNHQPRAA